MKNCLRVFLLVFAYLPIASATSLKLIERHTPKDQGAEIVSYTSDGFRIATTFSGGRDGYGVQLFKLTAEGKLQEEHCIDLGFCFGGEIYSVSSVALDPVGRGLGAVVVIPKDNAKTKGKLLLFNYRTAKLFGVGLDTGFHPDCANFSKDGRFLLVANEGEFSPIASAPGSLTVVDLTHFKEADEASISQLKAVDHDFRSCDLTGIRIHEPGVPAWEAIEPEYVHAVDDKAYVSLQENNALAVFDLKQNRWHSVFNLGTLTQTIDANSKDKVADISQVVTGIPMPDTTAVFTQKGETWVATANEGDARVDDFDVVKVATAKLDASLTPLATDEKIKNLEISALDGDMDHDGDIDKPIMFGSRSFSIWNAQTGNLVYDSGSLESLLLKEDKTLHNIDGGTVENFDKRSSKKGPEPEALSVGKMGDHFFLFLGLERQNGILMFDVTAPEKPVFVDYVNTLGEKLVSPESLVFVPASSNPTAKSLLLGGYELDGGAVAVFEIIP